MTPAKRRPATAASKDASKGAKGAKGASKGRTKAAKKDSTEEAPAGDAGGDPAPQTGTGQVDPEDRATTQPPRRSSALHPERVWPD